MTLVEQLKGVSTSNTRTIKYLKPSTYFVFNCCLLVLVQMHFDQLRTIQFHTDALSNDLCWENEIIEDVIIDGCKCTTAWTLLFVWVGATATWLGQNLQTYLVRTIPTIGLFPLLFNPRRLE